MERLSPMNRWSVLGIIMILVGIVIFIVEWDFIVKIVIDLLKLLAVVIGVVLVLGGIAILVFGGRWRKRRTFWGPAPTDT
jgi:uncharacterized membrane protein